MRHGNRQLTTLSSIALTLIVVHLASGAPATQPTGSISGTVTADGEVPLSEMVVYLESPDPQRVNLPTTQPVKISQKGAQFDPKLLIICVGQSVDFLNDESRPIEHNVFSNSPAKRFDLGLYQPGESKIVTFDQPGPVLLFCSIHKYMDGVIFVSPTPYTSRVTNDGRFTMDNVPRGDWVVKTWQRRKRFLEQSVPVKTEPGKPTSLDLELKHK